MIRCTLAPVLFGSENPGQHIWSLWLTLILPVQAILWGILYIKLYIYICVCDIKITIIYIYVIYKIYIIYMYICVIYMWYIIYIYISMCVGTWFYLQIQALWRATKKLFGSAASPRQERCRRFEKEPDAGAVRRIVSLGCQRATCK